MAGRPRVDEETIFIEQHRIQARGVRHDIATLPTDGYSPQSVMGIWATLDIDKGPGADLGPLLDTSGIRLVEQKLLRVLTERVQLSLPMD